MATPVFSVPLWEVLGAGIAPIGSNSPAVPLGFTWVIRSISAVWLQSPIGQAAPNLQVYVNGWPSWGTPIGASVSGRIYNSDELRLVLAAGETLSINPGGEGWWLRVTGYQLTA